MKYTKRLAFTMFLTSFMPMGNATVKKVEKKVIETIIFEASNQGIIGMTATASVIRNRAKERKQTFEQVVLAPYQFSCWNKGARHHKYTQEEYNKAEQAWELSKDFRLDANLYCRHDCYPYWREKVKEIARIGSHIFFKEEV